MHDTYKYTVYTVLYRKTIMTFHTLKLPGQIQEENCPLPASFYELHCEKELAALQNDMFTVDK